MPRFYFAYFVAGVIGLGLAYPQTPSSNLTLQGQVTDSSASSVPGANVSLRGQGSELRQSTDSQGMYRFPNLPAGSYTLQVNKPGFSPFEMQEMQISGPMTVNVPLVVAMETQKVTVAEEHAGVSVDPTANTGAIVLNGAALDALADDPDQLEQDLQALAGPSAGPNGGQIYIDGFTGGRLPPKSSIREVRVNSNPFSAEYDKLGFGRIEIFTKPGTDHFRGQIMTNFSDNLFNARNPFVSEKSPFQSRMFAGTLSGPVTKKSSFSIDVEHRAIDENAVVNATILDSSLTPARFSQAYVTPQSRLNLTPRFDWQLNDRNTLTARYAFSTIANENQGIGNFSLDGRAYNSHDAQNTLQLTETAVLSGTSITETRLQFMRSDVHNDGNYLTPTIQVLDAFTSGGSQLGGSKTTDDRWELSNITSLTRGAHTWKFGGRMRIANLTDSSPSNFGGTFTFSGGMAPELDVNNQIVTGSDGNPVLVQIDSLERYRRTQLFLQGGFTASQIRTLGGGASQFSIAGGIPASAVSQTDLGAFLLDDWRLRPNLTVSYGLRYEGQTNAGSWNNFAPRLSVAWGMDAKGGRAAKTVLRAGFGMFYDRVADTLALQALRFNGVTQQQYFITNPDFYPVVPSLATLSASTLPQTTRALSNSAQAPYVMQSSLGIDRQLPGGLSMSVNYNFSRGVHMLRTTEQNQGALYLYESSGVFRQNQIITSLNGRLGKRVNLFGFYMLNFAKGNTDGADTFPSNSNNLTSEYGSTTFDVRHRVFLGGSVTAPMRVMLSPFITASSGQPFNIITGLDNNGDTIINDRPAFATNPNAAGMIVTPWGVFNPNPAPGDKVIPRNYGRGPSQFSVNLRLSRTWGFGNKGESGPGANWTPPGMGGGRGPGGPGGPPPGGGPGGPFGFGGTSKRFNVTLSVSARNLLNNVNLAVPDGNLSSSLFGQSTSLAGGFGPMGASAASNRRIDMQVRFTF